METFRYEMAIQSYPVGCPGSFLLSASETYFKRA